MSESSDSGALTRKLVAAVIALTVALVVALVSVSFAMSAAASRDPAVLTVTDDGKVVKEVAVKEPYVDEARVTAMVEECVRDAFSHDFIHYAQTLSRAQRCFTDVAGSDFADQIDPMLADIKKFRRVLTISIERSAVVYARPYVDAKTGAYTWPVEAVASLGQEGTKDRVAPKSYQVRVKVVRVPLSVDIRGIRLSFISFKPLGSAAN